MTRDQLRYEVVTRFFRLCRDHRISMARVSNLFVEQIDICVSPSFLYQIRSCQRKAPQELVGAMAILLNTKTIEKSGDSEESAVKTCL